MRSIFAQSFFDYELLVIDDGSTDGGADLVRSLNDPRLRLISQENAGPGAARNRGAREARGEILAFLDADDEWLPEYLATGVRALDSAPPEIAATTTAYFKHPRGISTHALWRKRGISDGEFRLDPEAEVMTLVHSLAFMSPCTTMVRRSVFEACGGFVDRRGCLYGEDAGFWLKVLLRHPVLFNLAPLARIHTDASALSNSTRKARPLEPFLEYPEEIIEAAPLELRPLLGRFLQVRANKTACVWSWHGERDRARELQRKFAGSSGRSEPYSLPARILTSPAGPMAVQVARTLMRIAGYRF
jgi:hypothetical protein